MSRNKQQNPEIDFGFYASIPRIVRTNYEKITPIQKWLYVCLKDLCGDTGTCYRTLRVLSAETGISLGLLSESIPVLHSAGLIHAEKKKRSTGGKEVWHITIVDIWIANGKAHPTKKCSQNEQTQSSENVHNTNVHNVNETTGECSCGERECSQILDRRKNTLSKNNSEERTDNSVSDDNASSSQENTLLQEQLAKRDEQIALLLEQVTQLSTRIEQLSTSVEKPNNQTSTETNNETSYSHPATQPTPPSEPAQPANTKGTGRRTKKDATQDLTLQGAHIIEMYEVFKKRQITRNPDNVKAANGLGDVVASDQDINEVLTLIANDQFLKDKKVRVDLDFVYRKYDGYLDVVMRLREEAERRKSGKRTGNAPTASTPGSQYIVNELDEVADSYIDAMPEEQLVGIGD